MGIVYLVVSFLFFGFFTFMFVMREALKFKMLKKLSLEHNIVIGNIINTSITKRIMNFVCEYVSPNNKIKFTKLFTVRNIEENQKKYMSGKKVELQYLKSIGKKSTFFPVVLKDEPVKLYQSSFLVNVIFVFSSMLIFVYYLFSIIRMGYFIDLSIFINIEDIFDNLSLFIIVVMYMLGLQTVLSITLNLSRDETSDYIKLFGYKVIAKVEKSKETGSKASGLKEVMLDIEFFNLENEKIKTRISTFYYKSTSYVDILYSPLNHKNAVLCEK